MSWYMQHLQSHIESVSLTISSVERHRWKTDWLLNLSLDFTSVVNFGCSIGYETLSLLWLLDAQEAVGVDKEQSSIDQARSMVRSFLEDIEAIRRTLYYATEIPEGLRSQVDTLLDECGKRVPPSFVVADMTNRTDLPTDHFDLAYCERVLYHIACGDAKSVMSDVLFAVEEMARVTKPGGLIVAIEPNTCSPDNHTPVRLHEAFCRAGLVSVEIDEGLFSVEGKTVYSYSKPK